MSTWVDLALLLFFAGCGWGILCSALTSQQMHALVIAWCGALCSILAMLAAAGRLIVGQDVYFALWTLNGWGSLSLRLDALSAVFLFTAGLVYLSCSLFAPDYLLHYFRGDALSKRHGILHFALMATVVLVLVAGDALTFLLAWECMSLLCYLSVNAEQAQQQDIGAGYIMLAMSEAGFLAVVVAFLILGANAPDFSFPALRTAAGGLSNLATWGIFVLGFGGFGVKAGLVPVNFWLPRCYTASPAVFVPVLAGITLNLGLYGIVRLNGDLSAGGGVGPGLVVLITGSITAIVGILYATTENDLKTMLAYSSIENAGIVVAGVGAFLIFRNADAVAPAAIALTAALYHMTNHSIYKALLYQAAGHIEATTGTRDMDRLGGLIRILPALSAVFLVGCLAIAGLPPFNGFVSEWLVLQTFLRSAVLSSALIRIVFALCGALLALTAALAVTCFVKTYAMSFLGIRRAAWNPLDVLPRQRSGLSMVILAISCFLLGILPTYVIPAMDPAVEPLANASATASLVPPFFSATMGNQQLPSEFLQEFHNLGAQTGGSVIPGRGLVIMLRGSEQNPVVFAMSPAYSIIALVLLGLAVCVVVRRWTRERSLARRELWAGGIPVLLPEMTYTATGFSNPVRVIFQAVFRPKVIEDTRETVGVHFRTAIRHRREETYLVDRVFLHPIGDAVMWVARSLAAMHHGKLNAYVGYFLGFLILILFLYRFS
jgi:hydrogenase-4 component B